MYLTIFSVPSFTMPPFLSYISLILTSTLAYLLYTLLFHPLRALPGPLLARFTNLWLVWHTRKGTAHRFLPSLHAQYGPIVRIAPNTVLVCSEDAVKAIYGSGSAFTKGAWYEIAEAADKHRTKAEDVFDLLTERDDAKMRRQRRAIGPAYSVAGCEKHEALLNTYLSTFVARLKSLEGKTLDLAEWGHIFALDALSTVTLGRSPGYTQKGHDGGNADASDALWQCFTVVGLFPGLVRFMHSIPRVGMFLMLPACMLLRVRIPKKWPIFAFCVPEIMTRLGSTASLGAPSELPPYMDAGKRVEVERQPATHEKDILASLLQLHREKEAKTFPSSWVLAIALTSFGAGHDTIMFTLSSLIYHTYTSPSILARLRKDMEKQGITKDSRYRDIVHKVPLFMAVVKESMRLWPTIGFFLARVVPAQGALGLPAGTTVGASLWATNFDDDVFPQPECFRPDRWLPEGTEGDGTKDDGIEEKRAMISRMENIWMGFGGGSRSCPGQHLARFIVVKTLARLVEECEVEVQGEPVFGGWFQCTLGGLRMSVRDKEREGSTS
jgi:cytochrome P450